MTDRPIIFSAPMVRALLDWHKSQTRRVLTGACDEPPAYVEGGVVTALDENDRPYRWPRTYAVGDRLYVREAACWVSAWGWRYRADNDDLTEKRESGEVGKWRPSIHMPRSASRLTLTVTDVRVQRLQEISEADAWAEGCKQGDPWDSGNDFFPAEEPSPDGNGIIGWDCARDWYADLWDSLHGPDAWDANPWVMAVSFSVQRGNIDQIGGTHD